MNDPDYKSYIERWHREREMEKQLAKDAENGTDIPSAWLGCLLITVVLLMVALAIITVFFFPQIWNYFGNF